MSETVTYKGKLQKVAEGKEAIEAWCKQLVDFKGKTLESYHENYTEMVAEDFYKDFVLADDILFKVLSKEDLENEDIFELKDLGNGEYEYLVQYYNGGCGFSEAIEYSIKRLNKTS